jgi:hypothetical protein
MPFYVDIFYNNDVKNYFLNQSEEVKLIGVFLLVKKNKELHTLKVYYKLLLCR